ncbi:hypothetical protein MUO66_01575 [Candidatus Bathyarchaeota archaeon]|nr:hypothetical protein [Candidatus Bathyarchaeota archaeon]
MLSSKNILGSVFTSSEKTIIIIKALQQNCQRAGISKPPPIGQLQNFKGEYGNRKYEIKSGDSALLKQCLKIKRWRLVDEFRNFCMSDETEKVYQRLEEMINTY